MSTNIENTDDIEIRIHIDTNTNNIDTFSSTSRSEYIYHEVDNSFKNKMVIPYTFKSAENLLSLSKAMDKNCLQEMINQCKQMVLESPECSEERKWLVRRLIELRLKFQELRETANESTLQTCIILGHHFVLQKYYIAISVSIYCDHCSNGIWTMLQCWYMCKDCGFCCHLKCMASICRICVHVIASEAGGYVYAKDICPERGLSRQAYQCAECYTQLVFKTQWIEPRLCDYSGLYYCQRCHWNSLAVIPARIIRNWDMEPRQVCRSAFQLLTLLKTKPVLILEKLNKKLFTLVPDLPLIKRLREELQMMKQYLIICSKANNEGLPWKSGLRTHMLENNNNYSIKDLVDLQNGILMEEIQFTHNMMKNHITVTCELCTARGHLCEICDNGEVIYPWDSSTAICEICLTVFHRLCRSTINNCCPKCVRIQQRQSKQHDH